MIQSQATIAACQSLEQQTTLLKNEKSQIQSSKEDITYPSKITMILARKQNGLNIYFAHFQIYQTKKQQMIIEEPSLQKKIKPNDPLQDQLSSLLKWRNEYIPPIKPINQDEYKAIKTKDITSEQLENHAGDLSALFINIQWKLTEKESGKTIDDLRKISINEKLMNNGIIFIWSEKQILGEIMDIFEAKGFQYIENFMVTQLSADKALEMQRKNLNQQNKEKKITDFFKRLAPQKNIWSDITPEQTIEQDKFPPNNHVQDIFMDSDYDYFRKSKKILLMFRKFNKDAQLELRHQRTSDIFFDIFAKSNINEVSIKGMEFVYRMIETLLPKANYSEDNKKAPKMMEIYANDKTQPRKGWISVIEEQ